MPLSIRTFLLSGILLLAGCTASQPITQTQPPVPVPYDTVTTAAPATLAPARPVPNPVPLPLAFQQAIANDTRTATGVPGPDYWQQETDYTLTARLLPDENRLEGTARVVYTNNAPRALNAVVFELAQNLHAAGVVRNQPSEVTGGIELLRVAAAGRDLIADAEGTGYSIGGTQLIIVPPQPIGTGESVTIDLEWTFFIPQAGADGRMGYGGDTLYHLAYWYPHVAVYDDVIGWHTDPFRGRAEFYHGFADYDLTVEAPPGWLIASTGAFTNPEDVLDPRVVQRLQAAQASDTTQQVLSPDDYPTAFAAPDEDGLLRWHFTAEQVRDVAFSAASASIWDAARTPVGDLDDDGVTDYTIIHTLYRPSAPRWANVTAYQQHAITFFSDYTGLPYPWPHMTAVEGGEIIGGGMEFPMITLMGDYNQRGDQALYYVTAHELAHMWIPMLVSTNERRYSWIDEGATTFAENQARMDYFPGVNHNLPDQQSYLRFAMTGQEGEMMRWSDFHYDDTAFGVASYSKPATVLAALRGLLGEATFNEAYRSFIDTWAYQHPYPYDLFNTFERIADQDLDWFWRSWYYETWTLDQAIERVDVSDGSVTVTIQDLGSVPMPVRLAITLADGQVLTREVPVATWLRGATEATLTIATPGSATRVEIDPEMAFPDIDRSNNVWQP